MFCVQSWHVVWRERGRNMTLAVNQAGAHYIVAPVYLTSKLKKRRSFSLTSCYQKRFSSFSVLDLKMLLS